MTSSDLGSVPSLGGCVCVLRTRTAPPAPWSSVPPGNAEHLSLGPPVRLQDPCLPAFHCAVFLCSVHPCPSVERVPAEGCVTSVASAASLSGSAHCWPLHATLDRILEPALRLWWHSL